MTPRRPGGCAPPAQGGRHGMEQQTGWVHWRPELCAWTCCWKIHLRVLHEACFNQVLHRHLELGSTLVGLEGKEWFGFVFFPLFLKDCWMQLLTRHLDWSCKQQQHPLSRETSLCLCRAATE